jgi:hypothetical protein
MDERAGRGDTNVATQAVKAHEIVGAGRDLPVREGQSKREATRAARSADTIVGIWAHLRGIQRVRQPVDPTSL